VELFSPEYLAFADMYENTHKKPTVALYAQHLADRPDLPGSKELILKYGSRQKTVDSFLSTYHNENGYLKVPDYLLGSLVGRSKVVRRKDTGWTFLRFTTNDHDQIDAMAQYLHNWSVVNLNKEASSYELRISDYDLVLSLEHMDFFNNPPFIPNADFVRGYCDAHSSIRFYSALKKHESVRLTLSGILVPLVHDYLVSLGANNTSVIQEGPSLRMHIQPKSLRRIRDMLYPVGRVSNSRKRMQIYRA